MLTAWPSARVLDSVPALERASALKQHWIKALGAGTEIQSSHYTAGNGKWKLWIYVHSGCWGHLV